MYCRVQLHLIKLQQQYNTQAIALHHDCFYFNTFEILFLMLHCFFVAILMSFHVSSISNAVLLLVMEYFKLQYCYLCKFTRLFTVCVVKCRVAHS